MAAAGTQLESVAGALETRRTAREKAETTERASRLTAFKKILDIDLAEAKLAALAPDASAIDRLTEEAAIKKLKFEANNLHLKLGLPAPYPDVRLEYVRLGAAVAGGEGAPSGLGGGGRGYLAARADRAVNLLALRRTAGPYIRVTRQHSAVEPPTSATGQLADIGNPNRPSNPIASKGLGHTLREVK